MRDKILSVRRRCEIHNMLGDYSRDDTNSEWWDAVEALLFENEHLWRLISDKDYAQRFAFEAATYQKDVDTED